MKSYVEEFERKYERPVVNEMIVGFSGIDPSSKSEYDANKLSPQQVGIVNAEIQRVLRGLSIRIDSGLIE